VSFHATTSHDSTAISAISYLIEEFQASSISPECQVSQKTIACIVCSKMPSPCTAQRAPARLISFISPGALSKLSIFDGMRNVGLGWGRCVGRRWLFLENRAPCLVRDGALEKVLELQRSTTISLLSKRQLQPASDLRVSGGVIRVELRACWSTYGLWRISTRLRRRIGNQANRPTKHRRSL